MASLKECSEAIDGLVARLARIDTAVVEKYAVDRSLSCHIKDLDVTVSAELTEGRIVDLRHEPNPLAQVKVKVSSDDLVALTQGTLHAGHAWATGRVRVSASIRDLLRLRALF